MPRRTQNQTLLFSPQFITKPCAMAYCQIWALLLKQQSPTKENKLPFSVLVCTKVCHFRFSKNTQKFAVFYQIYFLFPVTRRHGGDMEMDTWKHKITKWKHGEVETQRHEDIKQKTENGSQGNFPCYIYPQTKHIQIGRHCHRFWSDQLVGQGVYITHNFSNSQWLERGGYEGGGVGAGERETALTGYPSPKGGLHPQRPQFWSLYGGDRISSLSWN